MTRKKEIFTEKLKLLDFHPEEFQKFTDSGYIVLNWHVQDSMGPDGKGKKRFGRLLCMLSKMEKF